MAKCYRVFDGRALLALLILVVSITGDPGTLGEFTLPKANDPPRHAKARRNRRSIGFGVRPLIGQSIVRLHGNHHGRDLPYADDCVQLLTEGLDLVTHSDILSLMAQIRTIDQLVDELGGPNQVGRWLNIGQNAVCNWHARGFIPPAWHFRLFIEIARRDLDVHPEVFGLTEDEAAPLMRNGRLVAYKVSQPKMTAVA